MASMYKSVRKVCLGCGSTDSMATIRRGGHLSCCPERKMVHPEYAKGYAAGYASALLNTRRNDRA